jgi:hypothetical protein
MKKLSILFLLIINVSALLHGSLTLHPSFDDDIYHFMGYPTSSKDTLGLSYGVSNYNGYPSDHSQSSFLYFDLSGISLNSNEIFAANLNLFVEPIDPNSPYASFRSGNVLLFEQGNFIETSTFTISDLSLGPAIGSFSVVEEGVQILINVTNTLKSWLNFERPNYGFLLMADSQSNIGTQFASMESLIAENRPSLELITNDDLELQLQMISSTSFSHAKLNDQFSSEYLWSTDLINWHNENAIINGVSVSFSETFNDNSDFKFMNVIINGEQPHALFYKIIVNISE